MNFRAKIKKRTIKSLRILFWWFRNVPAEARNIHDIAVCGRLLCAGLMCYPSILRVLIFCVQKLDYNKLLLTSSDFLTGHYEKDLCYDVNFGKPYGLC